MLALLFSLALISSQDPGRWGHVEIGDWTSLGESSDGDLMVLVQPARQRGKVWVRYEYARSESARHLVELDCVGWRTRVMEGAYFYGPNMTKDGVPISAGLWSTAAPSTFAEVILEYGCGE